GHGGADRIPFRGLPGLQQVTNVLIRPVLEPQLRDIRHPALAVRGGTSGEPLSCHDAAECIARAVTFGAMAWAVDQIGATVPSRRPGRIGSERLAVEIQQLPHPKPAPDVERKLEIMIAG